ncbi:cobalt-precorrin-5B (C(1))-methyltransferase CbiD [Butyrivibrio sp. WCD3002]|uniref:cobalt-precorrin-5B (C(1))-methyltransferase CbiD n=1 Tax=Butyrivibrio sp. WCD3002 TaxID=1280676 RepID=UPI000413DAF8|nr:cobalt-precorrin-5B (C(1))-methyltransferase CbiD [Butyrivibrio sp. WCD3002]
MSDIFIEKGGKKLRCGFTTGSCATAASKAALLMLLTGENLHHVSITTPKGITYNAEIVDIHRNDALEYVSCAVIKDGGDDPDVTSGAKIFASVCLTDEEGVEIDGGEGVGRVTKPGLDQPIGEAAINSVPRKMIRENLEEVLSLRGITGKGVRAVISVPDGEFIARKTFNPKLGIVGGISILGTTGIVEPMSDTAIVETIKTEISVRKAEGREILLAAPGNYGLTFLHEVYGIDESIAVMSSNFVYDTVKNAVDSGFSKLLFVGHIGKLVKIAGGIKNTHSMYGDHRMEILSEIVIDVAGHGIEDRILSCVMTDEAVKIINEEGIGDLVFDEMVSRIKRNMEEWSEGRIRAEVIVFSNENTELVATKNAHEWLSKI